LGADRAAVDVAVPAEVVVDRAADQEWMQALPTGATRSRSQCLGEISLTT